MAVHVHAWCRPKHAGHLESNGRAYRCMQLADMLDTELKLRVALAELHAADASNSHVQVDHSIMDLVLTNELLTVPAERACLSLSGLQARRMSQP